MWVEIAPFSEKYDAYYSEVAEFLERKGYDYYVDVYVSIHGLRSYSIKAEILDEDLKEIERICEMTGKVVTEISEPSEDPIIEEVVNHLLSAISYIEREKEDKREAVKRIIRVIRILKNCDGIGDRMRAFLEASRDNPWLKGVLNFWEVENDKELLASLKGGIWCKGVALIWNDFCFAEQCNGCGEFAVFKYSSKNGRAFQFESISADYMDVEKLTEFLRRISEATDEQLRKLEY